MVCINKKKRKRKKEAPKKFKNQQSARQVILTVFWEYSDLVYAKFEQFEPPLYSLA